MFIWLFESKSNEILEKVLSFGKWIYVYSEISSLLLFNEICDWLFWLFEFDNKALFSCWLLSGFLVII